MTRPIVVCLSLMMVAGRLCATAQEVTVTARVDSNNILIGDWLDLHLEVKHPAGIPTTFVAVPESLAGFEILATDSVVRTATGADIVERARWRITAYDSGMFIIPPLRVEFKSPGGAALMSAESSPIPIFVHGLGVDTSQAIKDIKPPIALGISFAEILPYLIGIVLLAAVVWLVRYYLKKRKRGEKLIPEPPPRPAHELALEALRSLDSEKYWQRGKVKEYHSKLTDIIRLYIERRFGAMALEMTTDEILDTPAIADLAAGLKSPLREMLMLADLVKFAKLQPLPEEHERSMKSAYSFIEETKQVNNRRTADQEKEKVAA